MDEPLFIAIDIDGTLLNSRETVDKATWVAIQRAMHEGHFVSLATGRMAKSALVWARYLELNAPVIAENGAEIVDVSGELIRCMPIHHDPLLRLARFVKDNGLYCMWIGQRRVVCNNLVPLRHWSLRGNEILWPGSLERYLDHPAEPVLRATIGGFPACKMAEVYSELQSWGTFELARSENGEIELTQHGVHKWSGIQHVTGAMQLSIDNVIAFGNSENDLQMLHHAALGYAVANADDIVLEQISLRTASNDDCGVAEAIETILNRRKLRLA